MNESSNVITITLQMLLYMILSLLLLFLEGRIRCHVCEWVKQRFPYKQENRKKYIEPLLEYKAAFQCNQYSCSISTIKITLYKY